MDWLVKKTFFLFSWNSFVVLRLKTNRNCVIRYGKPLAFYKKKIMYSENFGS